MYQVDVLAVTGVEPVTLAEIKDQLEIQSEDWDVRLGRLGRVAREVVEKRTGLLLRAQTIRMTFGGFAEPLRLPRAPIGAITAVGYGADVVADSRLITVLDQPQLRPALNASWPLTDELVLIEATAGYAEGAVPETLRHAILLLVADWFRDPENTALEVRHPIGIALDHLLVDHKLSWF